MGASFQGLLSDLKQGKRAALDAMMPAVYTELRRVAAAYLHRERHDHTLQPTALVHEAYLRLIGQREVDWKSRAHVIALGAQMMRRVLIDHAIGRNAAKRAGKLCRVPLDEGVRVVPPAEVDFLDLDRALNTLNEIDPQQATIVELRFFGGLTIEETAEVLDLSPTTVQREWAVARLWLLRHVTEEPAG